MINLTITNKKVQYTAKSESTTFEIGSPNILFMYNGLASTPTVTIQIQSFILPYYNGDSVNIAIDWTINITN